MTKHTPDDIAILNHSEWHADIIERPVPSGACTSVSIGTDHGRTVVLVVWEGWCDIQGDADARRIVALWNGCKGISTVALEGGVVADLLEAAKMGLCNAESWVIDQFQGTATFESKMAELEPIRVAIAKAESESDD